tara:strand:- start:59959 stop:60576 length:618 start_codon:yes stop_codon:yes gene_type:complete
MKNWKIASSESIDKYLIATEKSIWITDQIKGVDINQLIKDKNLGTIKSIRYSDLKKIIFIDSDFSIVFNFKEKDADKDEYKINKSQYGEIKRYFKAQLQGIETKNYSVFKQILPQLTTLAVFLVFAAVAYSTALDLENGIEIPESRKTSIIKNIVFFAAELLGTYGTLVFGILIAMVFVFFINKKIKNPKRGEVFIFKKSPRLKV